MISLVFGFRLNFIYLFLQIATKVLFLGFKIHKLSNFMQREIIESRKERCFEVGLREILVIGLEIKHLT